MYTGDFVAIQDGIHIHAKKYTAVRSSGPSMHCGATREADLGAAVALSVEETDLSPATSAGVVQRYQQGP